MAWGKKGAIAGAKAMHAAHGAGRLTSKQLAAARRNLSLRKKQAQTHGFHQKENKQKHRNAVCFSRSKARRYSNAWTTPNGC
jgi:hypothetical protein